MSAAFIKAIKEVFEKLSKEVFGDNLPPEPVMVYLAGGAATHIYTQARMSNDVDAEFHARMIRPPVVVTYMDGEEMRTVHLDQNYSPTLGMQHDGYQDRALEAGFEVKGFKVMLLAPVDLAITKLARFAEHDQADIKSLISAGLIDRQEFETLANEAVDIMVGNTGLAKASIKRVLSFFDELDDSNDQKQDEVPKNA